jgi:hypothetical protein
MHGKCAITLVVLLGIILACAGCTASVNSSLPAATPAATAPAISPASGVTTAGASLVPSPTDAVVDARKLNINVEKDYLGNVIFTFQGGAGLLHVKKIDVTLNRADGVVKSGTVGITAGSSATLEGTKQSDRAIVYVTLDDGTAYKFVDMLVPFKPRN